MKTLHLFQIVTDVPHDGGESLWTFAYCTAGDWYWRTDHPTDRWDCEDACTDFLVHLAGVEEQ